MGMISIRKVEMICPCCGEKILLETYAIKQIFDEMKAWSWLADDFVVMAEPAQ